MKEVPWHKIIAILIVVGGLLLILSAIIWLIYLLPKWAIVLLVLFILLK